VTPPGAGSRFKSRRGDCKGEGRKGMEGEGRSGRRTKKKE